MPEILLGYVYTVCLGHDNNENQELEAAQLQCLIHNANNFCQTYLTSEDNDKFMELTYALVALVTHDVINV